MPGLAALLLATSVGLQAMAAVIAWRQIARAGRYRFAWGCVCAALMFMIERRAVPLLNAIEGRAEAIDQTIFGLLISLLMLIGIWGLRLMFIDLRHHEETLARLAATDPLTGLTNRRGAIDLMVRELLRASRAGTPCSLLMLDLDRFKDINDRHGHAAGDAMLRAIAARFRAELRTADIVGRIGGEEFLVLLPETDAARAGQVAERLRAAIANIRVTTATAAIRITASIGATTLTGFRCTNAAGAERLLDAAMRDADRLLYQAKAGGRDRVSLDPTAATG
jgi:diguanylate cyclase (GGDEF)-like protein